MSVAAGPQGRIFGTDGVRGRANHSPMTVETALALGRSIAQVFRRHDGKHRVVIGKDTRLSGYMFENALIAGLCSMGVDTLMVGPLPTPGVAFITRAYRADAGIVISASHNPYYDNGIKIFSADGYKLPDSQEREIEALAQRSDFADFLPTDEAIGRNKRIQDADGRYIEYVKASYPKQLTLKPLRIVLDCANGAAWRVAPLIFQELDAELFVIGDEPNGLNINEQCGALYPKRLQEEVIARRADVGIALDGDGDRVLFVDEGGRCVDGDAVLGICAKEWKRLGLLEGNCIVGTVMSNLGLIRFLERCEIGFVASSVGDRYVIQKMLEVGANIGGEQSGHVIFHDYNTTGDGLVTALQVLSLMLRTKSTLSALTAQVPRYPQQTLSVHAEQKPELASLENLQAAIQEIESELGPEGRLLVRYSGTEPLCRVMVEAPTEERAGYYARRLAEIVSSEIHARVSPSAQKHFK